MATEKELVALYRNGNEAALTELIKHCKGFIYYIARRYEKSTRNTNYDVDDLVQEGWVGFLDAVERWNLNSENQFITFAGHYVRGRVLTFLNFTVCDRTSKHSSAERVQKVSIENNIPGAGELKVGETIEDYSARQSFDEVDFEIDNLILRCDLLDAMDAAFCNKSRAKNERMKQVLLLRYGFNGEPMIFEKIAESMSVTHPLIRQIHNEAIWDLQHNPIAQQLLKKYRYRMIEDLEAVKGSVNQLQPAEKIICSIETIDYQMQAINNLMDSILQVS